MVQRLAEGTVASRPALGDGEESHPLLSVQVKPVSGIVMEAHFAHVYRFT